LKHSVRAYHFVGCLWCL